MSTDFDQFKCRIDEALGCPAELGNLLQAFIIGSVGRDFVQGMLAAVLAGDPKIYAGIGGGAVLVHRTRDVAVSLRIIHERTDRLHLVGSDAIVAFRPGSPVVRDIYSVTEPRDFAVFQAGAKIALKRREPCAGAILEERVADNLVYDYFSETPSLCIRATRLPIRDQIWVFRRDDLTSEFPTVGEAAHSGLVLLCSMVAALREGRGVPLLNHLTGHRSHVVRWAAIQALGRLDSALGIAALRSALNDPHAHVRSTSQQILERLG